MIVAHGDRWLVAIVVVVLSGLLVQVVPSSADANDPAPVAPEQLFNPADPVFAAAADRAREEQRRRQAEFASSGDERRESRTEFSDLSDVAAIHLARSVFDEELTGSVDPLAGLPGGVNADRFTSETTAQLVSAAGNPIGEQLVSTVPLTTDAGSQDPIDLSLERQGNEFKTADARTLLTVPESADESASLPESGIAFAPSGADDATGVERGDRVLYPSIDTDTDYIVEPQALGAEAYWQLRSVDSPETLRFKLELRPGADLVEEPAADDGLAATVRSGSGVTASIPEVTAVDAAGRSVPVDSRVEGDTLVMDVDHHRSDVQYPVLVDPAINVTWVGSDWLYCGAYHWAGGWGTYNQQTTGGGSAFPVCDQRGLLGIYSNTGAYGYYKANTYYNLAYDVRPGTYVSNVAWDNLSVQGLNNSHAYAGLYSPTCGWQAQWQTNVNTNFPIGQDTGTGLNSACKNLALFGLYYDGDSPGGSSIANNQIRIAIKDPSPPSQADVVTETPSGSDVNGKRYYPWSSTAPKLAVSATDLGTGVAGVGAKRDNGQFIWGPIWFKSDGTATSTFSGVCAGVLKNPCPNSANTNASVGLQSFHDLTQGDNKATLIAWDSTGQNGPTREVHVQYDSTPPQVAAESTLLDLQGQTIDPDEYWLGAAATDDNSSGVTRMTFSVDGTVLADERQSCASSGCDLELSPQYWNATPGTHSLKVTAYDAASNSSERAWSVTVASSRAFVADDASPAPPAASGVGGGCPTATTVGTSPGEQPITSLRNGYWTTGAGVQAGETTWYLADGTYKVFRCDPSGQLLISQHVGQVPTPSGATLMLPDEVTVPDTQAGMYVTDFREYRPASDPNWSMTSAQATSAASETIPPTQ